MRRLNSVFTAVLLVQGVVAAFAKDDCILAWDVWNEPYGEAIRIEKHTGRSNCPHSLL